MLIHGLACSFDTCNERRQPLTSRPHAHEKRLNPHEIQIAPIVHAAATRNDPAESRIMHAM
jgi:hypothetical protein